MFPVAVMKVVIINFAVVVTIVMTVAVGFVVFVTSIFSALAMPYV